MARRLIEIREPTLNRFAQLSRYAAENAYSTLIASAPSMRGAIDEDMIRTGNPGRTALTHAFADAVAKLV